MKTINEKLREIRSQKSISQKQVADSAKISIASYSNIESGISKSISIEVGKGIAKALGVPFTELFEIEDNSKKIRELNTSLDETELLVGKLEEKFLLLKNTLKDKELLIELLQNEKARIRKDILYFLEEIYDTQTIILNKNKEALGLSSFQVKEIQNSIINMINTISTSYFMGKGLIREEDFDKITSKYIGKVRPDDTIK